jgi:hypothetical protein
MLKIDINRFVKKKTENIPIKLKITNPSQSAANKNSNKNGETGRAGQKLIGVLHRGSGKFCWSDSAMKGFAGATSGKRCRKNHTKNRQLATKHLEILFGVAHSIFIVLY